MRQSVPETKRRDGVPLLDRRHAESDATTVIFKENPHEEPCLGACRHRRSQRRSRQPRAGQLQLLHRESVSGKLPWRLQHQGRAVRAAAPRLRAPRAEAKERVGKERAVQSVEERFCQERTGEVDQERLASGEAADEAARLIAGTTWLAGVSPANLSSPQ